MCVYYTCTEGRQRSHHTVFTCWTLGLLGSVSNLAWQNIFGGEHGSTAGRSSVRNRASQYLDSYYLTVYKGDRVARRPIIHGPFLFFTFRIPEE